MERPLACRFANSSVSSLVLAHIFVCVDVLPVVDGVACFVGEILQVCDSGSDRWDREERIGVILTTATAQSVRLVVALSEARGTLRCRGCQFRSSMDSTW